MIHDVIYVPGLGDSRAKGQKWLISSWRLWGVRPHMVRMVWNEGDQFQPKLDVLLAKIDELHAEGHRVSLVGASAGATAVLNAFAVRSDKVSGVILIAGWVNYPENIGSMYRRKNPAFVASAEIVANSLNTLRASNVHARIQSRYGSIDMIVPQKYSMIQGANMKRVFGLGHGLTIVFQLLFGAPWWIHFLKRLAK